MGNPLGIAALGVQIGAIVNQLISSTAPRVIIWTATDSSGQPVQALNQLGQPTTSPQQALFPTIVVEERGEDELHITQHPVETGADITDHAYKLPAKLRLRAGWSFGDQGGPSPIPVATDSDYLNNIYSLLQQLQRNRTLLTIVTGKRTYTNMLLERIVVTTDELTENALFIVADCQEILFATTSTITVPDPSVMKNPSSNADTQNLGSVATLPGTAANVPAITSIIGGG